MCMSCFDGSILQTKHLTTSSTLPSFVQHILYETPNMKGSIYGPSCYRVTDSSSISPHVDGHGFTANDPLFTDNMGRPISGKAFMTDIQRPCLDDSSLVNSVEKHILGGWSTYHDPWRHSRWISTTADHEWAMWETARRLASGKVSWVDLAEITTYTKHSPHFRGTRKYGVKTVPWLQARGYGLRDRCFALAKSSGESLYYGRIFPRDIQSVQTWVADVSL
jgi:hypothetical protein